MISGWIFSFLPGYKEEWTGQLEAAIHRVKKAARSHDEYGAARGPAASRQHLESFRRQKQTRQESGCQERGPMALFLQALSNGTAAERCDYVHRSRGHRSRKAEATPFGVGVAMSQRKVWLPKYWYWLLLGASILLSGGGVILATLFHRTSQAGLGGAFAVALSFAALWVKDDLSGQLLSIFQTYRKSTEGFDSASQERILEDRLDELETVFWWRTAESRRQNVTVALASVIGTLTWALGEPLANALRRLF